MRDRAEKPYLRERAAALLKIAAGQSARAVAQTGLLRPRQPDTGYEWLNRYEAAGVAGLTIRDGRGRKPAYELDGPERAKDDLDQVLHCSPRRYGLKRSRWRLQDLRRVIPWLRDHSLAGVSQILTRLQISLKQAVSYVRSPDPDYGLKRSRMAQLFNRTLHQPERYVFLFQDELTYYSQPGPCPKYGAGGSHSPRVAPAPVENVMTRIGAVMDGLTGRVIYRQVDMFGKVAMAQLYRQIRQVYPERQLFVLQDNCNFHYSDNVLATAKALDIQPVYLPTYASWLNPIEKLWRWLKAGAYFEAQRWSEGVVCPYCSGPEIEKRERGKNGLQRYSCPSCAQAKGQQYRMFTVWSDSIYENSKLCPCLWLMVIAFWELKLNSSEIAMAVGLNEQTAARCVNLLDGSVYESHHLDPERQLQGQVEADECYQTAGHKGQPRRRVLKRRGRATAEQGRPPILGLVQRPDEEADTVAQVYLEVLPNVQTETIKPIILAKVQADSQFLTDEYGIYNFTDQAGYDHRTVNHGQGEYARYDPDGTVVHCNTMEGIWTGLRCFLRRFVGVSQKFLHLRVARFEFLYNHRHLDLFHCFQSALQLSFRATAGYWRQMVKKHRRIPLTLCYR